MTICRETLTRLRWVRKASETRLAPITSSTTAAAKRRSARLKRGWPARGRRRAATSVNATASRPVADRQARGEREDLLGLGVRVELGDEPARRA